MSLYWNLTEEKKKNGRWENAELQMIFFNRKKYLFLNYLSKNKDINYKNHFFLSHYDLSRCPAGDSVAGCTCSLISLQCEVVKSLGATRGPATAAGARPRAPRLPARGSGRCFPAGPVA